MMLRRARLPFFTSVAQDIFVGILGDL